MMQRLKEIGFPAVLCLLFYSSPSVSAPDGADLLSACRHALENGFDSIQGRMCRWYSMPCNCYPDQQAAPPPVCLPPEISHVTLARQVVEGLQEKPDVQQEKAERAAAMILVDYYPCTGDGE